MSKSSRRAFLTTAGTFLVAAAAAPLHAVKPLQAVDTPARGRGHSSDPASSWLNSQPQYQTISLYQFTPEMLQPLVGSAFQVTDNQGHRLSLRLIAVTDLSKQNPGAKTAFSLRFQQKGGTALEQGTYQFSTPPLGPFLLFVVPSQGPRGATYTAIINRI